MTKLSDDWPVLGVWHTLASASICDEDYRGFLPVMTDDVTRIVMIDRFGSLSAHSDCPRRHKNILRRLFYAASKELGERK